VWVHKSDFSCIVNIDAFKLVYIVFEDDRYLLTTNGRNTYHMWQILGSYRTREEAEIALAQICSALERGDALCRLG
jgi:hypothetical protein